MPYAPSGNKRNKPNQSYLSDSSYHPSEKLTKYLTNLIKRFTDVFVNIKYIKLTTPAPTLCL
jgi:hypothetical protein